MKLFLFLEKYRVAVTFLAIVVLAVVLRFYKLADVPRGMTWDEAAIGYNGFGIVTTRRDEWGNRLPISFRSFGDFKAPLAIYINGIFTFVLGMNLWAVRLPFALAGVFSVIGVILLAQTLLSGKRSFFLSSQLALFVGFFLTVSPWHLHFSRAGFESGMALCFVIWGLYFLLQILFENDKNDKALPFFLNNKILLVLLTAGSLVSAIYTYHSSKIVVPLLVLSTLVIFWKESKRSFKWLSMIGGISLIGLLPFLKDTFFAQGGERFTQASLFGLKLPFSELISQLTAHFFSHFSLSYLVMGATTTFRHGDGKWGVLFPDTLILVIFAVLFYGYVFLTKKKKLEASEVRMFFFSLIWIVIGTLPAAIGRDVPHSNRALLALPGFLFLAVLGFKNLVLILQKSKLNARVSGSKDEKDLLTKSFIGMVILVHLFFAGSYFNNYLTTFNTTSADDFKDGYIEAMQYVVAHEDEVDNVIISNAYGQPYIYVLWVRKTKPTDYHNGALIKYQYPDKVTIGDLSRSKALIVFTPKELEPDQLEKADKLIYGADGKVKFAIFKTKEAAL